jgi:hypothetical protein
LSPEQPLRIDRKEDVRASFVVDAEAGPLRQLGRPAVQPELETRGFRLEGSVCRYATGINRGPEAAGIGW